MNPINYCTLNAAYQGLNQPLSFSSSQTRERRQFDIVCAECRKGVRIEPTGHKCIHCYIFLDLFCNDCKRSKFGAVACKKCIDQISAKRTPCHVCGEAEWWKQTFVKEPDYTYCECGKVVCDCCSIKCTNWHCRKYVCKTCSPIHQHLACSICSQATKSCRVCKSRICDACFVEKAPTPSKCAPYCLTADLCINCYLSHFKACKEPTCFITDCPHNSRQKCDICQASIIHCKQIFIKKQLCDDCNNNSRMMKMCCKCDKHTNDLLNGLRKRFYQIFKNKEIHLAIIIMDMLYPFYQQSYKCRYCNKMSCLNHLNHSTIKGQTFVCKNCTSIDDQFKRKTRAAYVPVEVDFELYNSLIS